MIELQYRYSARIKAISEFPVSTEEGLRDLLQHAYNSGVRESLDKINDLSSLNAEMLRVITSNWSELDNNYEDGFIDGLIARAEKIEP